MSETEKKGLMDRLSEKERGVVIKHPLLGTAAITVATMAAAKPARKAANFVGGAVKGVFGGSKEKVVSDVAAAGANNMAHAAFKGGGGEEAAALAAGGLMSLAKKLVTSVVK